MNKAKAVSTAPAVNAGVSAIKNARLSVAFDATDAGYIGKGWMTTYAVLDLVIDMPTGQTEIALDLYTKIIAVVEDAHTFLQRERSFCSVNFRGSRPDYTVTVLLETPQEPKHRDELYHTANLLFRLSQTSNAFNAMYKSERFAFLAFAAARGQVVAVPLTSALSFGEHLAVGAGRIVLLEEYDEHWLAVAAMFEGNANFIAGAYHVVDPIFWARNRREYCEGLAV